MWRPLVRGITGRRALAERANSVDEGLAQVFQLHEFCLLIGQRLVQFVQHVVLMRESHFEVYKALFRHDYPLFTCRISGRIHAHFPD